MFRMAKPKISWEEYQKLMYEIALGLASLYDAKTTTAYFNKRARLYAKRALQLHKRFQGI